MKFKERSLGLTVVAAGILVLALAVWAAAADEPAPAREVVVEMSNFAFTPAQIVVAPGEKIRFLVKNPSSGYHTFTVARSKGDENYLVDADAPPRQDQVIEMEMPNEEITLYLVCLPHETLGMVGSIVVTSKTTQ